MGKATIVLEFDVDQKISVEELKKKIEEVSEQIAVELVSGDNKFLDIVVKKVKIEV